MNRWGLELATYIITFEWILGASNKASDCPFKQVELPHDRKATVQMLSATNHDGPTFHTRSRTAQCINTEDLTLHPKTNTVTPDIPKVTDTPDATQNYSLRIDYKHYFRCGEWMPSVNASPSIYQTERH